MSTSTTGLPSSSSRSAPPTTHASSPARISCASSTIDDGAPGAGRVAVHAAYDLVVDRARDAGMLFGEDPVPEQDDGRAGRKLAVELDGERVHRHRADCAAP